MMRVSPAMLADIASLKATVKHQNDRIGVLEAQVQSLQLAPGGTSFDPATQRISSSIHVTFTEPFRWIDASVTFPAMH